LKKKRRPGRTRKKRERTPAGVPRVIADRGRTSADFEQKGGRPKIFKTPCSYTGGGGSDDPGGGGVVMTEKAPNLAGGKKKRNTRELQSQSKREKKRGTLAPSRGGKRLQKLKGEEAERKAHPEPGKEGGKTGPQGLPEGKQEKGKGEIIL